MAPHIIELNLNLAQLALSLAQLSPSLFNFLLELRFDLIWNVKYSLMYLVEIFCLHEQKKLIYPRPEFEAEQFCLLWGVGTREQSGIFSYQNRLHSTPIRTHSDPILDICDIWTTLKWGRIRFLLLRKIFLWKIPESHFVLGVAFNLPFFWYKKTIQILGSLDKLIELLRGKNLVVQYWEKDNWSWINLKNFNFENIEYIILLLEWLQQHLRKVMTSMVKAGGWLWLVTVF